MKNPARLPDDALVVRGGLNLPEQLETGSGVIKDGMGKLHDVSVNCAPGKSVEELTESVPNRQVGLTTVGQIRAAGGEVTLDRTRFNPDQCLVSGLDAMTLSALLRPVSANPSRPKPE